VALDSAFVEAWVQLSRAYSTLYFVGTVTPAVAEGARGAAERAARLAPGRPAAQLALGDFQQFVRGDAAAALGAYELGLQKAPADAELLSATGRVEQSLGRWESSILRYTRADAVDPRSVLNARRQAVALLWLRRYPEADAAFDRGIAFSPATPLLHQGKAMVRLAQGDLAGARAVLRRIPPEVDPAAMVASMATYWDLFWVLDEAQQQLLLRLTPSAFDDDRSRWGIALAETYALRGNRVEARAYADSAAAAFESQLRATPDDPQLHALLGTVYAYAGRKADAIREGRLAVEKKPLAADAYTGPYIQHQLARIYLLVGEPEQALDQLEPLLSLPYYLSPGWLRIDPTLAPLRMNPRFQRLAGAAAP
jgi:Flp pilus assembly protein TadD